MGFSRQEYWSDLPFLLQWTTFCQTSPPWPAHLGLLNISGVKIYSPFFTLSFPPMECHTHVLYYWSTSELILCSLFSLPMCKWVFWLSLIQITEMAICNQLFPIMVIIIRIHLAASKRKFSSSYHKFQRIPEIGWTSSHNLIKFQVPLFNNFIAFALFHVLLLFYNGFLQGR